MNTFEKYETYCFTDVWGAILRIKTKNYWKNMKYENHMKIRQNIEIHIMFILC